MLRAGEEALVLAKADRTRVTLERLQSAAHQGADPARTHARLLALKGLLDGELEVLEARLGPLCEPAPRDVRAAARHLLDAGGKRVRPLLLLLAVRAARPDAPWNESTRALAAAAELVHNATLLHDDVIDEGRFRRGLPASRMIWGNAVSVLSGDFLLTRALELVEGTRLPGALSSLLEVIRLMIEGEALQLARRGALDLSVATYNDVVDRKTAALFSWCGRAGALAAETDGAAASALGAYGFHIGRAFQIVDDVLDLAGESDRIGKDLLSDLKQGKLTLPILLAAAESGALVKAIEALAQESDASVAQEMAARIAREAARTDGAGRARRAARLETDAACAALVELPPGPHRVALEGIARELAERGA